MENLKSLFIQAIDNTIEEQLLTAQNFLQIQSGDVAPLVALQLEQTKEQLADRSSPSKWPNGSRRRKR